MSAKSIFPFQMRCLEVLLRTRSYRETAQRLDYPKTEDPVNDNDGSVWVALAVLKVMRLPKGSSLRTLVEPLYWARQHELADRREATSSRMGPCRDL